MQDSEADQNWIYGRSCETESLGEQVVPTSRSSATRIIAAWFFFGCVILVQFVVAFGTILCLVLSVLLGYVRRQEQGDVSIYTHQPWVIVVIALLAAGAVVAGWFLRRWNRWVGYEAITGGLLVLGTTVPGISYSWTLVDSDHCEWRRGFNHSSVRYRDLAEITHNVKRIPIGRTRQDVHYLDFKMKTGSVIHMQIEGFHRCFLDAVPEIVQRARTKGVTITE